MACVPEEEFEAYYKETCRHIVNETYRLWPFLWQNRSRLFDPKNNQHSIRPMHAACDRLRGGTVLLLSQTIPFYLRLHK